MKINIFSLFAFVCVVFCACAACVFICCVLVCAFVVAAKEELNRMLAEDELRDAVLLVFANKQDLPNISHVQAGFKNIPKTMISFMSAEVRGVSHNYRCIAGSRKGILCCYCLNLEFPEKFYDVARCFGVMIRGNDYSDRRMLAYLIKNWLPARINARVT